MTVKVEMYMDVNDLDEIKRIEHHIEEFVDIDNWLDVITSIYGVKVEEVE